MSNPVCAAFDGINEILEQTPKDTKASIDNMFSALEAWLNQSIKEDRVLQLDSNYQIVPETTDNVVPETVPHVLPVVEPVVEINPVSMDINTSDKLRKPTNAAEEEELRLVLNKMRMRELMDELLKRNNRTKGKRCDLIELLFNIIVHGDDQANSSPSSSMTSNTTTNKVVINSDNSMNNAEKQNIENDDNKYVIIDEDMKKMSGLTSTLPSKNNIEAIEIERKKAIEEHNRLEKERLEKERLEREKAEKERLEKERLEKERLEKERLEKERIEMEKAEIERIEREKAEIERLKKEKEEKEKEEKEKAEKQKLVQPKIEPITNKKLPVNINNAPLPPEIPKIHEEKTPLWIQDKYLSQYFYRQFGDNKNYFGIDPDSIFGHVMTCDLEDIFPDSTHIQDFQKRGSSGNWMVDQDETN